MRSGHRHLQVYASYNFRRDLTMAVKLPGMLSRARSLSREEAETQEADVGKADVGVSVHPPTMRQAVAWELAMRNIRQSEVRSNSNCQSFEAHEAMYCSVPCSKA